MAERLADEGVEFDGVLVEAEDAEVRVEQRADALQDEAELAGRLVRRGDVPVEVVLVEEVDDFVVWDEGDLLAVEGAEEGRREVLVEGAGLAEGEDELGEEGGEVVADARLGLGPEQTFVFGCSGFFNAEARRRGVTN